MWWIFLSNLVKCPSLLHLESKTTTFAGAPMLSREKGVKLWFLSKSDTECTPLCPTLLALDGVRCVAVRQMYIAMKSDVVCVVKLLGLSVLCRSLTGGHFNRPLVRHIYQDPCLCLCPKMMRFYLLDTLFSFCLPL